MSLNQRKSTQQKPRKIWDQTNYVSKSEMTLNRVTKRQYSTIIFDQKCKFCRPVMCYFNGPPIPRNRQFGINAGNSASEPAQYSVCRKTAKQTKNSVPLPLLYHLTCVCLSVCQSVCLSACLSVGPSICLFICPYFVSVCKCIRLFPVYSYFLDAPSHLYKRSCPSVGP